MSAFLRQDEAWIFVRDIADEKIRVLVELALANALSELTQSPDYASCVQSGRPLDLYTFAVGVHAFLRKKELVGAVLEGAVKSIDDLDPFPS